MLELVSIAISAIILWYLLTFSFLWLKRKSDFYNNKVVTTTNLWAYSFEVFINQIDMIIDTTKILYSKLLAYSNDKSKQDRKLLALQKVTNHLNATLSEDLGLKIINPATTAGVDIWVYLSNNLNESEKNALEDYFIGVISKYTTEFALDILIIEPNAGAGWIAKFDVKSIEEATYNRMARSSQVHMEEDF